MPDQKSLVGLQKLAAANSNTATKHILQSLMYLTVKVCENVSLRVADMLNFPLTKESVLSSINIFNTNTLGEIQKLSMHDFGIYLQLEPDEEERAMLEQNIQMALQQQQITLEDAIETLLGVEIVDETDSVVDMRKLALDNWRKKRRKTQE